MSSTFIDDNHIPESYEDAVETLARWQSDDQIADLRIYSFPDPAGNVVRLAEISNEFSQESDIRPFTFGRSPEFPFKSSILLLSNLQWERIVTHLLELPDGWNLASMVKVWPNDPI